MIRFGHTEQFVRIYGEETARAVCEKSRGMGCVVPVAGPGGFATYDGHLVRQVQGATGFTSFQDLITESVSLGKMQRMFLNKSGVTASTVASMSHHSLWSTAGEPGAGLTPAAIPGGEAPDWTSIGGLNFLNPNGSDTAWIAGCNITPAAVTQTYLFYDRLFAAGSVDHTITTDQAVTGVPDRYTGTAAAGNIAFLEVTTALGATAQNLTMTYVDENGNTAEAAPALAMVASAGVARLPHAPLAIPLNSPDLGLRNVTNLAFSAGNSAGVSSVVIARPLLWFPTAVGGAFHMLDGVLNTFTLFQVQTNACIAILQVFSGTSASSPLIRGHLTVVYG